MSNRQTSGQNFTRRRRLEARHRALLDKNWRVVGWLDRRLNKTESACPFPTGSPEREQWIAGFRAEVLT